MALLLELSQRESGPGVPRFFKRAQQAQDLLLSWIFASEEEAPDAPILQAIEQYTARGAAVAPRAPRLLIVVVDGIRKIPVHDAAHIGLVDAEAERAGCDDHSA